MSSDLNIIVNYEDIGQAVAGGLVIGLITTLNLLLYGKITGVSGILYGSVFPDNKQEFAWKFPFLLGLLSLPYVLFMQTGREIVFKGTPIGDYNLVLFDDIKKTVLDLHIVGWLLAGFLVGVGAKLSNGCLSGHIICGLPRLNLRSWIASFLILASAFGMASFRNSYPFLTQGEYVEQDAWDFFGFILWLVSFGLLFVTLVGLDISKFWRALFQIICGSLFSLGLILSGLSRKTKVLAFFTIKEEWDPQIGIALGVALLFNLITFSVIIRVKQTPALESEFNFQKKAPLDCFLFLGSILFGLGWGLAGIAPGAAIVDLMSNAHLVPFVGMLLLGKYLMSQFTDKNMNASREEKEPLTGFWQVEFMPLNRLETYYKLFYQLNHLYLLYYINLLIQPLPYISTQNLLLYMQISDLSFSVILLTLFSLQSLATDIQEVMIKDKGHNKIRSQNSVHQDFYS